MNETIIAITIMGAFALLMGLWNFREGQKLGYFKAQIDAFRKKYDIPEKIRGGVK